MDVRQLLEALRELDPETVVYLAADEEWNYLTELYQVEKQKIYDDGEYRGASAVHPDDVDEYDEDELVSGIVLW